MKTKYKHVHFKKMGDHWRCFNEYDVELGRVEIVPYPFFSPRHGTGYTIKSLTETMADIIDFMNQLNAGRKK